MIENTLTEARWTHIALPTGDLDAAIAFYTSMTPLVVVERFADDDGESAWLSNNKQVDTPMVLVLVSFNKDKGGKLGLLHPFAHIGIEVPIARMSTRSPRRLGKWGTCTGSRGRCRTRSGTSAR